MWVSQQHYSQTLTNRRRHQWGVSSQIRPHVWTKRFTGVAASASTPNPSELNCDPVLFCIPSAVLTSPTYFHLLKPLIYKINRLHDVTRLLPVRFPLIWFTSCSLIMQWNQITVITRSYSSCNTAEKYSALLFQRQKLIFKQFCIEMVVICVNIQHSAVVGCDCSLFCLKTKQLLHLNGWNQTKSL